VLLHSIDDIGGCVDILFLALDYQPALASAELNVERLTQNTKITVGGAEQFQLLVG
jgi:hypothetical protein